MVDEYDDGSVASGDDIGAVGMMVAMEQERWCELKRQLYRLLKLLLVKGFKSGVNCKVEENVKLFICKIELLLAY